LSDTKSNRGLTSAVRQSSSDALFAAGQAGTVETMQPDSRVVSSTTDGDVRKARDATVKERRADGDRVKVRREVAGRRAKAVTTVSGVLVDDARLELAASSRKRCGVGGSVKGGVTEIPATTATWWSRS
jgi:translation initiation factor 1